MGSAHAPRRQRRIQQQVSRADKVRPKQEAEQALQAGASDYVAKPLDVDKLLSLIRVWLTDKG